MTKSATDVMQEIMYSAVVDALLALRTASKGVPNALLRDINAVHPNTTFADLPPELQAAIGTSVRAAFTRLLKEGYSVSPAGSAPRSAPPRRDGPREGQRDGSPRRDGPSGERRPRSPDQRGGRPPGASTGQARGGRPPRGGGKPSGGGGGRGGPRKPQG